MSQNSWFEHFKEQLQGLTEAYESSGSPLSLLGYTLQEKRLSSEDYLQWAATHFQLPRIQSRFFTETPISQEMFAKWATHYRWSVECLPVAEWDGSLIVACLQPPQDFPSFPTSVLVLAEPEMLVKAWQDLHPRSAPVEKPKAAATSDIPEGIDLSAPTAPGKKSDAFSFEDLGFGTSESTNPGVELSEESSSGSTLEAAEEGLSGLLEIPTVVKLEALGSTPPPPGPAEVPVVTSEETDAVSSSEKTVVLEKLPTEKTAALEKVEVAPKVETETNPGTAAVKPPPPPPLENIEDSFSNRPIPITPRPTGIAKPTINPVASGHFALEKIKKKNSVLNDRIKQILSEMKAYFEKSMILTLDEAETQLTAFAWDENFQDIKDSTARFPLKTPSIFNIVVTTQKPYHGYVSLNQINEKFFEDWNQGRVPDHITVSPLLIGEKMVGLLVGFADRTAYNKVSLHHAEKLSGDFVKGLQAA